MNIDGRVLIIDIIESFKQLLNTNKHYGQNIKLQINSNEIKSMSINFTDRY